MLLVHRYGRVPLVCLHVVADLAACCGRYGCSFCRQIVYSCVSMCVAPVYPVRLVVLVVSQCDGTAKAVPVLCAVPVPLSVPVLLNDWC